MKNDGKRGYYQRILSSCEEKIAKLSSENEMLVRENKRLTEALTQNEETIKAYSERIEKLSEDYSAGILELADARDAYIEALKAVNGLKKNIKKE